MCYSECIREAKPCHFPECFAVVRDMPPVTAAREGVPLKSLAATATQPTHGGEGERERCREKVRKAN